MKKTYFYSLFEQEFSKLLKENLKKKYKALYNPKDYSLDKSEPNGLSFSIKPIGISSKHQKIVEYKGTIIKGWMGKYKLIEVAPNYEA